MRRDARRSSGIRLVLMLRGLCRFDPLPLSSVEEVSVPINVDFPRRRYTNHETVYGR
jgi:hypothetical protein